MYAIRKNPNTLPKKPYCLHSSCLFLAKMLQYKNILKLYKQQKLLFTVTDVQHHVHMFINWDQDLHHSGQKVTVAKSISVLISEFQAAKQKMLTTPHSQSHSEVPLPFCVAISNHRTRRLQALLEDTPSNLQRLATKGIQPSLINPKKQDAACCPLSMCPQVPAQRTGLMLRGSPNRFSNDEVESSSPPVFTWKYHKSYQVYKSQISVITVYQIKISLSWLITIVYFQKWSYKKKASFHTPYIFMEIVKAISKEVDGI